MSATSSPGPIPATTFAAAAAAIEARFDRTCGLRRRERFRFGPVAAEIAVHEPAGGEFADRMLRRLQHARVAPDAPGGPTAVTVRAVNLGGDVPDAVAALGDAIPGGVEFVHLTDGGSMRAVWQPDCGALDMMNLETGDALSCIARPDRAPGWLFSAPFRHLLNWATLPLSVFEAHGAGIMRNGAGLLLAGSSGAGKSTLTAWTADAGFETVGDDAVLVEQANGHAPRGHALFDNVKLEAAMRDRLAFAQRLDWLDANSRNKSMALLSEIRPGALARSIPISAIVVPRIAGVPETRILPSNAGTAIRALAPSTLHQFKGGEHRTFPKIAALCRSVPVFEMQTGTEEAGAVGALAQLSAELSA